MNIDPVVLLVLVVALAAGGFAYWKWGWKGLAGALAAVGALAVALLRRPAPVKAPVLAPLPPKDEGAEEVSKVAVGVVEAKAATDLDAVARAAGDPDRLADELRRQR